MLLYKNILKNYQDILNAPHPKMDKETKIFVALLVAYILLTIGIMMFLWEDLDSSTPLEDENFLVAMLLMGGFIVFGSWGISLFAPQENKDSRYQAKKKLYSKQLFDLKRLLVQHKMYMIDAQTQYKTNREMMQKVRDIDRDLIVLKKKYEKA